MQIAVIGTSARMPARPVAKGVFRPDPVSGATVWLLMTAAAFTLAAGELAEVPLPVALCDVAGVIGLTGVTLDVVLGTCSLERNFKIWPKLVPKLFCATRR